MIDGIDALTSLTRATGALSFCEKPNQRLIIISVRMGSAHNWQMMRTDSDAFAAYTRARANRRDPFFNVAAGGADICNVPVPTHGAPKEQ